MHDESQLAEILKTLGCDLGRSRSGRLLRVDCRSCPALPELNLLQRVLECQALRELYVPRSGDFPNSAIEQLAGLQKLKVLDLEDSDLDDKSVEQLANHAGLQVLNVRNTNVTEACVARLRKVMIGTRIIQ